MGSVSRLWETETTTAWCLDICSLQRVKPNSLFLIHVLFSLKKKNPYPALLCMRKTHTHIEWSQPVLVIRDDIEWLGTRGTGTISTAFSPHLEFSC